ncbi:MAG: DUF58 domain-containing protein [Planctomycetia bacterium]
MAKSVLSRYLDPDTLSRMADRPIEPRGLVMGSLAGKHKSPLAGFAVEFASHREYVPGDDPRHIDWRVFYTRDKYFIKQYEMETNFVCHLVLDVSKSMRYGDDDAQKLLYAARMAASLGFSVIKQSDKVSLTTFDEQVVGHVPPSNSMAQIVRVTAHLDAIDPVKKTDIAACLSDVHGRIGRREIVMVFSDFLGTDLEKLESVLQRLRYDRNEVVLFQVMHHDELTFDLEGMVKFVGLEVPDQLLTQPSELRKGYLEALNRFNGTFDDVCQRNRVERVLVDTSRQMGEVFVDYLNHRSLLNRGR